MSNAIVDACAKNLKFTADLHSFGKNSRYQVCRNKPEMSFISIDAV
jgi:hypothetical protein